MNILNFKPLKNSISLSYIKDYSDFLSSNGAINRTVLLNKVKTIINVSFPVKGIQNIENIDDFLNKNIKDLTLVPIYDNIIYREEETGENDLFNIEYPSCESDDFLLYGNNFNDLQYVKIERIDNFFIKTEVPISNLNKLLIPAKVMTLTNSFNIDKISNKYYIYNCQFTQLN